MLISWHNDQVWEIDASKRYILNSLAGVSQILLLFAYLFIPHKTLAQKKTHTEQSIFLHRWSLLLRTARTCPEFRENIENSWKRPHTNEAPFNCANAAASHGRVVSLNSSNAPTIASGSRSSASDGRPPSSSATTAHDVPRQKLWEWHRYV